ncbi:hypothetical protein L3Q65_21535 [Amycolatopsis sp. FU40]|uniref:hypothetical protein n=1 Tax=Amycolatopsis sp. FU40 TaxID=2914159 RepID=UPI001F25CBDB|nr:hypothetical protein [Amycolatopsis sp. FU40]UKD60010.1 hypothetical protein L3Q65_21535 [Amycolatopsis sp. FU40]
MGDPQSLSAPEIIALVKSGKGSDDLFHGSDMSRGFSTDHNDVADKMLQLQGKMSQYWQGDAAGQANAGAGPLVQASKVSGQHLQAVDGLYSGQGGSYNTLKSKVQSVGDIGDRPSDDLVSGTWFSFLSNRADQIKQWDEKAQVVVDSYHGYYGESQNNSGQWAGPSQYGQLTMPAAGGDFSVGQPGGSGIGNGPSPYTPGGRGHGGTSGVPRSGGYSDGPGGSGGFVGTGGPGGTGGSGGGTHSDGSAGGPALGPGTPTGSYVPSDGTRASGYVPPSGGTVGDANYWSPVGGQTGGSGGNNPTGGGMSFGPGAGFVPGGGFGPGGSGGSAGGYGSGSGYGAGGSSGGAGRGAGAGTGSGALNAGASAQTGTPASGAAGRPGAAGMGGMGAGGKGGKGEEDTEHKTADYLLEQDPDDALVGELPKAVPPVIGA